MSITSMQPETFTPSSDEHQPDPTGWRPTETERTAELSVLGAMLQPAKTTHADGTREDINSPAIGEVAQLLQPGDLFRPAHTAIFQASVEVAERGGRVDELTIGSELEHRGELARAGGQMYLHQLVSGLPTGANAAYYAEQVREAARRRAAIELARRIQQVAADRSHGEPLATAIEHAWSDYEDALSGATGEPLTSVAEDTDMLTEVLNQWGTESASALSTGLSDLDRHLNVDLGGLVVIGARSGVGKSILASQFARHYAFTRSEHAIVFNMEMSTRELVQRDYAAMARVRLDSADGKTTLDERDRNNLVRTASRYQDEGHRLHLDDTRNVGIAHIRARMQQLHYQHRDEGGLGLVVVDQLQLMHRPERRQREDQEFAEITRQLKILAGEYQCVIVLVSQLNRDPDSRPDGKPRYSDLKGSGATEQDADAVLLLHDVGAWDEARLGDLDVVLDKQRKGTSHAVVTLSDCRHRAGFENSTTDQ